MGKKEKLIVILGPTASGKTALSVDLAKYFDTEIISGDSMLVYKGFDIGSAKPQEEEKQGILHHMIDILPPKANFNVTDFLEMVRPVISGLNQRGRIPILAGGTGLYVKSLLEGYSFNAQGEDKEYRLYLEKMSMAKGKEYVHQLLAQVDPKAAERLHVNDQRRIIRALEVAKLGKENISQERAGELVYDAYVLGLQWDRGVLYERINQRVDIMVENGLLQEVQGLLAQGLDASMQAMKGIGYKEMLPVCKGEIPLSKAIEEIKKNSRHFAKRQLTWYRKMPYINWYEVEKYQGGCLLSKVIFDIEDWMNKEE